jgi:glycosyltransferase involved in cell wall biosynthesis
LLLQDELNHPSLFWTNRRLHRQVSYPIAAIVHHLRSSERRPEWQNRLYRLVERAYLAEVDGFIYNSRTTQQAVETLTGLSRPSFVAYPGGDRLQAEITAEAIARRAFRPGPLHLFFLGNLIPRKGLNTLLEALAGLPGNQWQLVVAGSQEADPAYARAVRKQAAALKLDGRVQFLGRLEEGELARWLSDSHVLVVPSSYEGYGIVYLEGMGFGLPAVATTAGAAGEIITDGREGFLVPSGDTAALADRLKVLAQDRNCLLRMSLAARQRYLAHPTWEQSMAAAGSFLHSLAQQRHVLPG